MLGVKEGKLTPEIWLLLGYPGHKTTTDFPLIRTKHKHNNFVLNLCRNNGSLDVSVSRVGSLHYVVYLYTVTTYLTCFITVTISVVMFDWNSIRTAQNCVCVWHGCFWLAFVFLARWVVDLNSVSVTGKFYTFIDSQIFVFFIYLYETNHRDMEDCYF